MLPRGKRESWATIRSLRAADAAAGVFNLRPGGGADTVDLNGELLAEITIAANLVDLYRDFIDAPK